MDPTMEEGEEGSEPEANSEVTILDEMRWWILFRWRLLWP